MLMLPLFYEDFQDKLPFCVHTGHLYAHIVLNKNMQHPSFLFPYNTLRCYNMPQIPILLFVMLSQILSQSESSPTSMFHLKMYNTYLEKTLHLMPNTSFLPVKHYHRLFEEVPLHVHTCPL